MPDHGFAHYFRISPVGGSSRGLAALAATVVMATSAVDAKAALDLPKPSPLATVTQRVGLTDISFEYSSPGVKGRKIWGELVPYDELWRTGANAATKVTFSHDVTVADKEVAAGTYAVFTIPGKKKWTFILNSDAAQNGTRKYDEAKDVLRVDVEPTKIGHRERLALLVTDFDDDGGKLTLEWEKLSISVPVVVDTAAQAADAIDAALDEGARNYAGAARYLLDNDQDPVRALALAEKATLLEGGWFNKFILARALAANERWGDAVAEGKAAFELGEQAEYFFWRDLVAKSIKEWEGNSGGGE